MIILENRAKSHPKRK